MTETALLFGDDCPLVGVITEPAQPPACVAAPAVVLLNAGLVHHVGMNRLNVRLARSFASQGLLALRFDFSGIGDSRPSRDRSPLAHRRVLETTCAMNLLAERHGARSFLLVGNCSGAAAAYLAAHADPRVEALGLLNPQGPAGLRYHLRLALSLPQFWRRLVRGRLRLPGSLPWRLGAAQSAAPAERLRHDVAGGLRTLARRGVDMLLVHSEWDPGYDYVRHGLGLDFAAAELRERATLAVVPGANHEFSLRPHQDQLVQLLAGWTERLRRERWS